LEFRACIDGVEVVLDPPNDVKTRRGLGEICRFKCRCNLENLRIRSEEIKGGLGGI